MLWGLYPYLLLSHITPSYLLKTLVQRSFCSSGTKLSSVPMHTTYLIAWLLGFSILMSVTQPPCHSHSHGFILNILSGNWSNAKYTKSKLYIWSRLSILPFSPQLWNTAFHLCTHIPIPLTPLIICYLLSPPSFSSYFIQLRLHDLSPQWLFLASKTILPYFLPDVPKSRDFELFSSQLFLNY